MATPALSPQDIKDLQDIAGKLPPGDPRANKVSLLLNSQPTQFEQERSPGNQEGFLSAAGEDIKSLAKSIPKIGAPMVFMPLEGIKHGMADLQEYRKTGKTLEQEDAEQRKSAGHGNLYSYIGAPTAEGLGANVKGMEHAADVGDTAGVLGHTAVPVATAAAPLIGEGILKGAGALHEAALGDPNASALRGLQVGPKSSKALRTIENVEASRPYLKGAKNLADLQGKVKGAQSEIWNPYQQAVESIAERHVQGPDGPTTVGQLEELRKENSAMRDGLRAKDPEVVQRLLQKNLKEADLVDRQKAIESALDPMLEQTGIDPKGIRKQFAQVSDVGSKVRGKSTLIEKEQPYGLGKIKNIRPIERPSSILGAPLEGIRDIAAGRPIWSGKPTDVNIREGFRMGGEKPHFGTPAPRPNPRALLGPGAIQVPSAMEPIGEPSPVPRVEPTTRAQRLGLLLPESTGGRIPLPESSVRPPFEPTPPIAETTRAQRKNLLLPERGTGKTELPFHFFDPREMEGVEHWPYQYGKPVIEGEVPKIEEPVKTTPKKKAK